MRAIIGLAALALTACAGTDTHMRMLENDNAISAMPAPADAPYDWVVSLKNKKDFGYNPDNLETRQSTALAYLKETCPSASIVDEATLSTGKYLLGNSARTYHVYIACV